MTGEMKTMIRDGQTLKGAKFSSGHELSVYDDGYGPLWISRNSIGINGIVRAKTLEEAYSICEDEFFPEADLTVEELQLEYGFNREHKKIVADKNGERFETEEDYVNGKLVPQFVKWETIETLDADAWPENELFQEAYGFRPNGPNQTDQLNHGIYVKDLNGDSLDLLTPELLAELDITLDIIDDNEA